MGANLLMLPFLMIFLDENTLGLWYVFASIGAIATLFDFGFGVTFARNVTYAWAGARELKKEGAELAINSEPDYRLMKKVLKTCKIIYGIIAGSALLLLLTLGTGYVIFVSREINGYTYIIAWIIYAVAVFLNLYYGYYASFLRGVGNVAQANKNTVWARLLQIILMVVLLFMKFGLIGACVAYLAYGTLFRLLGNCYTSYFSCTNRIIYVGGFTISAILCVGLSFVAIGPLNMGIWGLISAQIISQAVYNLWKWPSLGHKELGLSIKDMIYIGNQETVALLHQCLRHFFLFLFKWHCSGSSFGPHWGLTPMWSNQKTFRKIA